MPCFLILGTSILVLATATFAQTPPVQTKTPVLEAVTYENQQRAHRLLQFDDEIKTLPDVEIRCQLRSIILSFIYTNDTKSEYPAAEQLLNAFFVDMTANEKLLPASRTKSWGNSMALLLRKHAPETAKKIEAKYVHEVDTSREEYDEIRKGGNRKEIIDRAVAWLATGKDPFAAYNVYISVRRIDKEAASRILQTALDLGERQPGTQLVTLLREIIDGTYNPPAPTLEPKDMLRYYKCLVASARIEISTPHPDNYYFSTISPLRQALPTIHEVDKGLSADGAAIIAEYQKSLSKAKLLYDKASERIRTTDNKLEQALAEAETAPNPQQRDVFLGWAANLAVQQKDYHRAVDLMLKTAPDLGLPSRPRGRDEDIVGRIVRPAYRNKDYDDAYYAIDHIKDDLIRAKAMIEAGCDRGRLNIKDREGAVAYIINALDLLEMTTPDFSAISGMGNSRSLLTALTAKPAMTIDEFTARAVGTINRLPTQGADAKAGSPERTQYVTNILAPTLGSVDYIFHPVWDGSPIPDPKFADEIRVKEWRLAARISAESVRRYPLVR